MSKFKFGKIWASLLEEMEFYQKYGFWLEIAAALRIAVLCMFVFLFIAEKEVPLYRLILMAIILCVTIYEARILVRGKIITNCVEQSYRFYPSLWELMDDMVLGGLGNYVGHSPCCEVATLSMMLFEENHTSRLVIAEVGRCGERTRHAWVEFKAYGLWRAFDPNCNGNFIFDPNCNGKFIRLRFRHNRKIQAKYQRIIPHQEFWNYLIPKMIPASNS